MTQINRQEAIRTGATRYFGKVCEKHPEFEGERRTANNWCQRCYKENQVKYRSENKQKVAATKKLWFDSNKERKRISDKKYRDSFDETKLAANRIRLLILASIKRRGFTKKSKSMDILGCSWEEFKTHIEKQFADGMSWENRDKWHIDHIIPMVCAKTEEDAIKLNHYSNLRPLWAFDNLSKGAKIEY